MQHIENWLWDLLANFGVLVFLFLLRLVLIASNGTSLKLSQLLPELLELLDGKEASLLVVSYCITVMRRIQSMIHIPIFYGILYGVLIVFAIFSGALFVLSYDHPYIQSALKKNPKPTRIVSLIFLTISIIGSLVYTILQSFV